MKNNILAIAVFIGVLFYSCTKKSGTVSDTAIPAGAAAHGAQSNARFSGPHYSQSIPLDTANSMIGSYLSSINYPSVDTAIRSLSFDADTLRGYLQNSNIVTLKFMIAHRPEYKALHYGQNAGMSPGALTVVVVGQDDADNYVLNTRNEVYEHMFPCPSYCTGSAGGALIH